MSTINETDKNKIFRCGNKTLDQRKSEYYAKQAKSRRKKEELLEEMALKKEFEL